MKQITVFSGLLAACAAHSSVKPLEIWMIGSDIGAPQVVLTHELRDALEAVVASRHLQAPRPGEHVYIPEFVRIQGDHFEYRAILTRDNENAIRTSNGTCQRNALAACADRILADLTKN